MAVGAHHEPLPSPWDNLAGCILGEGWAASVERRKEVERIQDRLPSGGALEGDDPHEARQETADAPILRHELLVRVVIGRPSESCYRIHGCRLSEILGSWPLLVVVGREIPYATHAR